MPKEGSREWKIYWLNYYDRFDHLKERLGPDIINHLDGYALTENNAQAKCSHLSDRLNSSSVLSLEEITILKYDQEKAINFRDLIERKSDQYTAFAITQIQFTPKENDIIEEASKNIDVLRQQFPAVSTRELEITYKQHLTVFLQNTIFYQNTTGCINTIEKIIYDDHLAPDILFLVNSFSIPHDEFIFTMEEQTLATIDEIQGGEFPELDEFNSEDYDITPAEKFRLESLIWPTSPEAKEELISIWGDLSEEDKILIYSDPTGLEGALLISDRLGKPLDAEVEVKGKLFVESLHRVNFKKYWFENSSMTITEP
jgi:hypothetical protein